MGFLTAGFPQLPFVRRIELKYFLLLHLSAKDRRRWTDIVGHFPYFFEQMPIVRFICGFCGIRMRIQVVVEGLRLCRANFFLFRKEEDYR